jgi:hypothetical protein
MATPMSADKLVKVLRDAGLKVVEVPGWRTNNRNHKGSWGPVHGVMLHHTVTSGTAASVALCFRGHSTLPGPLCHGVIDKAGTVHLVGNGRANHAGLGDDDVLRAVISERPLPADNEANTDGNAAFYGFEPVNLGDGKDPWPLAQLEAVFKASAAVCKAHGWSERSVIGHLEWQPGKIDPRGPGWPGMDIARGRIKRYIDGTTTKPPATKPPATKPPTPPKEKPVEYTQIHRESALTVAPGAQLKVYFDGNDTADEPNEHGVGGYTFLSSARRYHGVVAVWSEDAGQPFTVLMVQEKPDASTSVSSYAQTQLSAASATTSDVVSVPVAGQLGTDRKLHLQIRNDSPATLVLDRIELRLFSTAL